MELFEYQQKIINKKIPKNSLFIGDECNIINLYIEQICKYMGLTRCDIESASTVLMPQKTISLLGDKLLYVCKYDKSITTAEKLWQNVKYLGTNYLVLIYTTIDKRSKFYNYFKDNIVEFTEQDDKTLKIMLNNQHSLCEGAVNRLIKGCQNNYGKCLLELDKISKLSKVRNISQDDAYKALLKDNAIYEESNNNIDIFVNAVLNRTTDAYKQYDLLKRQNESNIQIIGWLYNGFRTQLIVETVKTPNTESTGLNYYFIKQALDRRKNYSIRELENALTVIRNTEQGIKNGSIDESISIDYILSMVM